MILVKFKSFEQELAEVQAELPRLERRVRRGMALIGWSIVASLAVAASLSGLMESFPSVPRIYGIILALLAMAGLVGSSILFEGRAEVREFDARQRIRKIEDEQYELRTDGDRSHG